MHGSINATYIDAEYKKRKIYENKKRHKCVDKNCDECVYKTICEDKEE